jgi:hypothetical protein
MPSRSAGFVRYLHAHRADIEKVVGSPLGFWWIPRHEVVRR